MNKKIEIERIAVVRDTFVFCCFTGLSFVDVQNLKKEHLIKDNSDYWIRKRRKKTNNLCNIPLMDQAHQIIKKYEHYPFVINDGFLLPVRSNQKMNLYLKEIADICGINKRLTTHCARHTFATTVGLSNGASLSNIAKVLGHSSTKMTEVYAKTIDTDLFKAMSTISNKYSELLRPEQMNCLALNYDI